MGVRDGGDGRRLLGHAVLNEVLQRLLHGEFVLPAKTALEGESKRERERKTERIQNADDTQREILSMTDSSLILFSQETEKTQNITFLGLAS